MKAIEIRPGIIASVDDIDFKLISMYKWGLQRVGRNLYAKTKINGRCVLMHRLILNINDSSIHVDHKDHNGLNNQRSNIRICDRSSNQKNRRSSLSGTSKYLGVHFDQNRWRARIKVGEKQVHLGRYKNEEDAALAYDRASLFYHGEFANINFKGSAKLPKPDQITEPDRKESV